ncbi:glycosyl transferase family 1 [bacterium]|nr:glycosyl transferase family 1 [bacterium]
MKKVLIITYYWPPSGGSGVQRWLKFSKYLPENGWQPIIYTPENPSFETIDYDLMDDINSELKVWKSPIWEPYSLKESLFGKSESSNLGIIHNKESFINKTLNWLRGNIFIPDPKLFWVKPSIKLLYKKIKEENINHIVSTGPPHSMHLIALGLKKKYPDIKWIADFRDPWSELDLLDEFYLTKRSKERYCDLEREVLQNANISLTVSENWVESLKSLGSKNVKLITNGYDEEDFCLKEKKIDKFIIGHFGLLNHLRNPSNLWDSLNQLCAENSVFNNKLEIRLSGNIDSEVLKSIIQFSHLKNKVKLFGYLSHKEVLMQYNESSLLLLLLFNSKSGTGNYPGKIFEYFAAKKPILAFGPEKSDTKNLISKTESGIYHSYLDTDLESTILSYFNADSFNINSNFIKDFSRKKLTKELSELLNKM